MIQHFFLLGKVGRSCSEERAHLLRSKCILGRDDLCKDVLQRNQVRHPHVAGCQPRLVAFLYLDHIGKNPFQVLRTCVFPVKHFLVILLNGIPLAGNSGIKNRAIPPVPKAVREVAPLFVLDFRNQAFQLFQVPLGKISNHRDPPLSYHRRRTVVCCDHIALKLSEHGGACFQQFVP